MEIGSKLKAARLNAGVTQEEAAQKLVVSRQSLSRWENGRAYPELSYVIKMSSLYGLSLDELLRDKNAYVGFIQKSTRKSIGQSATHHSAAANTEKKSRRVTVTMILELIALLAIWAGFSLHYYYTYTIAYPKGVPFNAEPDVLGYHIVVYIFLLPPLIVLISGFIGADPGWKRDKWFLIPVIAFSGQLILTLTFGEQNSLFGHDFFTIFISLTLPESILSLGGMFAGTFIGRAIQNARRKKHGAEREAAGGADTK